MTGLDFVLSGWCSWAKVTHVINCIGTTTPEYRKAKDAEKKDVCYHSWVYKYKPHWEARYRFFHMVSLWLQDPRNVVVFHCRTGMERAPFTLLLIMVLAFNLKKSEATTILAPHSGDPFPNIDDKRFLSSLNR